MKGLFSTMKDCAKMRETPKKFMQRLFRHILSSTRASGRALRTAPPSICQRDATSARSTLDC